MIETIKRNMQMIMLLVALSFLLGSTLASFLDQDALSRYLHIAYFAVIIPFIIVSTKIAKKRRVEMDESIYNFMQQYRLAGQARVRYFVPTESDHTTINMWRKFRGKHALSMFKGQYSDDDDVCSYRTYLLTEKELFQAKLRGYYDTEDSIIAVKGSSDPWMIEKSVMHR